MIRRLIMISFFLWLAGFFWFVEGVPVESDENGEIPKSDAIIALTGGMGRITTAIDVLQQNIAPKLFITGVGTDVTLPELIQQDVSPNKRKPLRYYRSRVELGYVARSTAGNVREANGWMVANPVKSIVLVTSNYHMPRSLYLFRQAFPQLVITTKSTFGPAFRSEDWWRHSDVLGLAFSEYHKLLMSYFLYSVIAAKLV